MLRRSTIKAAIWFCVTLETIFRPMHLDWKIFCSFIRCQANLCIEGGSANSRLILMMMAKLATLWWQRWQTCTGCHAYKHGRYFFKGCHHPGGSYMDLAHVTFHTCHVNVQATNTPTWNWYCVYKSKEEGYILMKIPQKSVLAGTKFWASNLLTKIFFDLKPYLPYRIWPFSWLHMVGSHRSSFSLKTHVFHCIEYQSTHHNHQQKEL